MTEEVNNEEVGLTVQDVAMSVQVIDLACKRGGFEGPEMEVIGALRGRLASFVQANTPAEEAAEEASE